MIKIKLDKFTVDFIVVFINKKIKEIKKDEKRIRKIYDEYLVLWFMFDDR